MLRRSHSLGVTILALAVVAAPIFAVEAEKKSAKETSTSAKAAQARAQRDVVPTFTNADLETLPGTDNSELPSLEDDNGASANAFVIIGTPPAEGEEAPQAAPDPAQAAQSLEWVERMRAERERADRIAAAQRRVRQAEMRVNEVEKTYRPRGSAFSKGRNTDDWFFRGVASTSERYDVLLRDAYIELAAARAELQEILEASDTRREGSAEGAS